MKILYYTSGKTGAGRVTRGIAIFNALKRKQIDCSFLILCSNNFSHLLNIFNISHFEIPLEDEIELSKVNYKNSILYDTLITEKPDILIVDLLWFTIHNFINEIPCRKIFLCRQVFHDYFSIDFQGETITFNPEDYDYLFSIEPFNAPFEMTPLSPFVLRNRGEILSREEAAEKLKIDKGRKTCFLYCNGEPGEFQEIKDMFSYLEKEGYQVIYSSNYDKGLFPVTDYFNVADHVICGGGYNSFWETKYFQKDTIYIPAERNFESHEFRIQHNRDFTFDENGADQLVDFIMKL